MSEWSVRSSGYGHRELEITLRGVEIDAFEAFLRRATAHMTLTDDEKAVFTPFSTKFKVLEPDPVPEPVLGADFPAEETSGADQKRSDTYGPALEAMQELINRSLLRRSWLEQVWNTGAGGVVHFPLYTGD